MPPADRNPRVLFFPSYFGGGFGHLGRSLALAQAFQGHGWQTAMLASGPAAAGLGRHPGLQLFRPVFPKRPERYTGQAGPAYTSLAGAGFQALRDGYTHPWRVYAAVLEALFYVRRYRPRLLVGDLSLLTWIVGHRSGVPVVQLVRSMMHPDNTLPGLPPALAETLGAIVPPDVRPVFNPLLQRWGMPPLQRAEHLFRGDLYLVPSLPELEPLPGDIAHTVYTGPLLRRPVEAALPPEFTPPPGCPVVYVTLGGGAGPVGSLRMFEIMNQAFQGMPVQFVIATGHKFHPSRLPPAPENVSYHAWLPGPQAVAHSQAVITHGGYGTLMEMVHLGVPGVVLPFHTEQEANGRRLESCSASLVLSPASPGRLQTVQGRWRYGDFTYQTVQELALDSKDLRQAVERVLSQERFRAGAQELAALSAQYAGAEGAIQTIEWRL